MTALTAHAVPNPVHAAPPASPQRPPALGGVASVEHITGIAVVDRDAATRIFILLDIEHLVSDATLQAEFTDLAA